MPSSTERQGGRSRMSDLRALPSVLIVSTTSVDIGSASGACMASLFARWPAEQLAQFVRYRSLFADSGVAGSTFVADDAPDLRNEGVERWLRSTGADLVYARAAEWPEPWWDLGRQIAEMLDVPFVFHLFDNTVGWCRAEFSETNATLRAIRCDLTVERNVRQAAAVFTCSESHSQTLESLYGVDSEPILRTLESRAAPLAAIPALIDYEAEIRLAYAGRCNVHQHRATFELVADAAKRMSETGQPVVIDCIGPNENDFSALLSDRPDLNGTVRFHGSLGSQEAQFDFLNQRDGILVTFNFDELSRQYIGDSLSSKLLDALATDRPVFVVGPPSLESVAFAQRTGSATVLDTRNTDEIDAMLENFRADRETPDSQRRARELVRRDWSPDVVLERFEAAMRTAAGWA